MVLTMSRMRSQGPDAKRVTAIVGVLLIHLVVLAVILLPRQPATLWKPAPAPEISLDWLEPLAPPKPPELVIPPPPPPIVLQPVLPRPATTESPLAPPTQPIVSNDIIAATPGDPVVPGALVDPTAAGPSPGTTGSLVSLQTLRAPPPAYPRRELARRIEGSVELRVLVDADGVPTRFEVIGGSRNKNFELAAIRAVRRWRFQAHRVGGVAQPAWALVPFVFRID